MLMCTLSCMGVVDLPQMLSEFETNELRATPALRRPTHPHITARVCVKTPALKLQAD